MIIRIIRSDRSIDRRYRESNFGSSMALLKPLLLTGLTTTMALSGCPMMIQEQRSTPNPILEQPEIDRGYERCESTVPSGWRWHGGRILIENFEARVGAWKDKRGEDNKKPLYLLPLVISEGRIGDIPLCLSCCHSIASRSYKSRSSNFIFIQRGWHEVRGIVGKSTWVVYCKQLVEIRARAMRDALARAS